MNLFFQLPSNTFGSICGIDDIPRQDVELLLSQVTIRMATTNIEAYGAYPFSSDETYQVGYTFIAFSS